MTSVTYNRDPIRLNYENDFSSGLYYWCRLHHSQREKVHEGCRPFTRRILDPKALSGVLGLSYQMWLILNHIAFLFVIFFITD